MNKIIKIIIDQSSSPQISYKTFRTGDLKKFTTHFRVLEKKWEDSEYIWSGTHALKHLGSLSPTFGFAFP